MVVVLVPSVRGMPASSEPRTFPLPLESTIRVVQTPAATTGRWASMACSASSPFEATVRKEPTPSAGEGFAS
jgi:hypothetical protein